MSNDVGFWATVVLQWIIVLVAILNEIPPPINLILLATQVVLLGLGCMFHRRAAVRRNK